MAGSAVGAELPSGQAVGGRHAEGVGPRFWLWSFGRPSAGACAEPGGAYHCPGEGLWVVWRVGKRHLRN